MNLMCSQGAKTLVWMGSSAQMEPLCVPAPPGEWQGWFYQIPSVFSNPELRSGEENGSSRCVPGGQILFCVSLSAKGEEKKRNKGLHYLWEQSFF